MKITIDGVTWTVTLINWHNQTIRCQQYDFSGHFIKGTSVFAFADLPADILAALRATRIEGVP